MKRAIPVGDVWSTELPGKLGPSLEQITGKLGEGPCEALSWYHKIGIVTVGSE